MIQLTENQVRLLTDGASTEGHLFVVSDKQNKTTDEFWQLTEYGLTQDVSDRFQDVIQEYLAKYNKLFSVVAMTDQAVALFGKSKRTVQ